MYPQAASAIEQVAVFVYAAECRLAVIDADLAHRVGTGRCRRPDCCPDALRRLHVYPPRGTADGRHR